MTNYTITKTADLMVYKLEVSESFKQTVVQCFIEATHVGSSKPVEVYIQASTIYGITLMHHTEQIHFHPLEVVSHYRDPQPHVGENYSYMCLI